MNNIPSWASKYIGIPYKAKGTTLKGMDCLGLLELIYKEQLNIELPFNEHLEVENDKQMEIATNSIINGKEKWKQLVWPEKFCVININILGYPVHFGLCLNDEYMIHSLKGHNSVIERFTGIKWSSRVEGFYRYEG